MNEVKHSEDGYVNVRRGRLGSVDVYEVTDDELEKLAKGTTASVDLAFSIFLLTLAFSCVVVLTTTKPMWNSEYIYVIVGFTSLVFGIYFLIMWRKSKTDANKLIKKIKERIPAPDDSDEIKKPFVNAPTYSNARKGRQERRRFKSRSIR